MQTWRTEKTEKGAPHLQRCMQLWTQQGNAKPQMRQQPGRLTVSEFGKKVSQPLNQCIKLADQGCTNDSTIQIEKERKAMMERKKNNVLHLPFAAA